MLEPVFEPDLADQIVYELLVRRLPGQLGRQEDVLLGVQHREQIEELEDEADMPPAELRQIVVAEVRDLGAVDRYGARCGPIEAGEDVHERRLARARGAHDGGELALRNVERDAAQRVDGRVALAVAAGDVMCGDDRVRRRRSLLRFESACFHVKNLQTSGGTAPRVSTTRSRFKVGSRRLYLRLTEPRCLAREASRYRQPGAKSARPADEPSPAAGRDGGRLAGDDRARGPGRPLRQGRGREPIPHSLALHGADAALREADGGLPGPLLGPGGREPVHLPLPGSEPRRDRRLRDAGDGSGVRRNRHVREADRRPARRGRLGAGRVRLHRRGPAVRAVHRRRAAGRPDEVVEADPRGPLLRAWRQSRRFVRFPRLGHRGARRPDRPGLPHLLAAEPARHA